ncbi:hypothetical protein GCM10011331_17450 [Flavimobilis marinus]|uniref:Uncharacterized protein n=1 Tax=Flavimobilis marinus TaxID=285351 RepID=A0A1I2FBT5_9MICO|nr:hypothetical protein [Flavimobilis marinus]GHG52551.1 hypothetical protein GCM10011331_17450 [Flavimobilis marinus]SFF02227.1 hypothetical protein SAMN04488035_1213 [Flavimobilis marinus]
MKRPEARVHVATGRTVPRWALGGAAALAAVVAAACTSPAPAMWWVLAPLVALAATGRGVGVAPVVAALVLACAVAAPPGPAMLGVSVGLPVFLYATWLGRTAGRARVELAVLASTARPLLVLAGAGSALVGAALLVPVADRGWWGLAAPLALVGLVIVVVPRAWWPTRR